MQEPPKDFVVFTEGECYPKRYIKMADDDQWGVMAWNEHWLNLYYLLGRKKAFEAYTSEPGVFVLAEKTCEQQIPDFNFCALCRGVREESGKCFLCNDESTPAKP
jgi:hypothetical protein